MECPVCRRLDLCPRHTPDAFRDAYERAKSDLGRAQLAFDRAREEFGEAARAFQRLSDLAWALLDGDAT